MPDSQELLDPYLDPETGILRNLVGARARDSLDDAEGSLSFARLVQLMGRPPKSTGDLAELCAIHRHLFQDLYDWAGQISASSTSARTSRVRSSSCRQG